MVIFFTEADLVSFGEYMMSAQRRKSFDSTQPGTGTIEERLAMVHESDLSNWAYLESITPENTNNQEIN